MTSKHQLLPDTKNKRKIKLHLLLGPKKLSGSSSAGENNGETERGRTHVSLSRASFLARVKCDSGISRDMDIYAIIWLSYARLYVRW